MSRSVVVAMDAATDADQARLHQLGYRQELKRGLSLVSNFAFSFSIISVMTGVTTTYNTGLRYGGPVSMTLGWLVVSAFNGCIALSMAEICSAYPTSGGLYYWSAKLAGKEWAPLASWVTGWFNIVGQLLQVIVLLATGGANGGGYMASKYVVLAIYCAILISHGLINSLPIQWLSWFGRLGAFWNVAGVAHHRLGIDAFSVFRDSSSDHDSTISLICSSLWTKQLIPGVFALTILIPSVAKERASPEFIFTHFNTENGMGIHDKAYILAVGLLMSQYSLVGYDTSAHMVEETKNADWNGPIGIITSVALSTMFGWIYLVALASVMVDIPYLLSPDNDAGGYAVAQALYTSFHRRYGTGVGALACLGVIAAAIFLCGSACVTSNSRMAYAFSRDGAMPLSRVWHRVNGREVPLNVVWLSVSVAFAMALTSLGSQVAFQAMVSIATLGLCISCALPVFFRVTTARRSFVPGPFHLGRYGLAVGWAAVLWVATVTVLFAAGGVPGGQGDVQLHAGGRRRRAAAQPRRVGAPCPLLWAATASVDFALAQLVQVIVLLATGGAHGGGYMASKYVVLAVDGAMLITHGAINRQQPPDPVPLLVRPVRSFLECCRASIEYIFTHFNTENGMGIRDQAYILLIGLLMSQYSMAGYDTSAHMTEETKNADWNGPIGIVTSVALSTVFGWIYMVSLSSTATDIPYLLSPDNDAGGNAVAQALYAAFHRRYGTGLGGILFLGIVAVAVFLCGVACVTSNSSSCMLVTNAVWLSAVVAFIMALTSLGSQVAFQAMVPIATIGLCISYAPPIFFRVTTARRSFVPAPFRLGRYGIAVGWAAVLCVATVTVLFSLPVAYPVAEETFNYTPAAVGAWALRARFWFRGPITNTDDGP
uniref:Amino acid permease/ SLC12A domain-containing protein n=1 Tax=Oryza brachyantha TaxID=4533 RepID=J3L7R9_ORYBR